MVLSDIKLWIGIIIFLIVVAFLYALSPILMPFAAGALLAYMGNPLVLRLMRLGLTRPLAVTVTFLTVTISVLTALILVLPLIWQQFVYVEKKIPALLKWFNAHALPWLESHLHIRIHRIDMDFVMQGLSGYLAEAGAATGNVLTHVAASSLGLISVLAMLAIIPVVTFYLLLDWDALLKSIQRLLPLPAQNKITRLAVECDEVLSAFIRGQLLVMLVLGFIYALGLSIVGLKIALIIGVVAGLGSIIPYAGFLIGITAASIAAIIQFGSFSHVLLVWLVFAIGQMLEGWVLQPYLVGDKIGLHPVAVIFAIMAGGQLFGFFGMLLALPTAAIIRVLLAHGFSQYEKSHFYRNKGL
jgi:predicted PurR-regulated permease PerM